MDVRVDEPGEDILASRVDHFGITRNINLRRNLSDDFALAEYVGNVVVRGRDDSAVFN